MPIIKYIVEVTTNNNKAFSKVVYSFNDYELAKKEYELEKEELWSKDTVKLIKRVTGESDRTLESYTKED